MKRWPFLRSIRPGQIRSDPDEEIREELDLYLELRAEELEREEGLGPAEARRVAEERFGDPTRIESELREQARRRRGRQGTKMTMTGLRQDLRYAVRTFVRSPGFSLVAVLTLALALGGNTAIFSVVDAALLQSLPFEDPDELVFVNGYHLVDGEIAVRGASVPEFRDWRERARSFTAMAAVDGNSVALTGSGGDAERLPAEFVTQDYFGLMGGTPEVGRVFLPDEHAVPGASPVAVVSYTFWERRYGLAPSAVGTDVIVNDRPLTIVGIMPEGFGGINLGTDIWIPESMLSLTGSADRLDSRGSRFLTVAARLAPGVSLEAAQAELDAIARDLQATYPRAHEDRFAQVQPFREGYLGSTGGLLWILMGAGGVLLLIASANVANLLLVRSHGRTREFVLRRALGAETGRVAAQLVTESVMLAAAGGVLGIVLAVWALEVLGPMIPAGVLPGYVQPTLSANVFLFSLAVLGFVGITTGLVPAAASARIDIATRLRAGAKSVGGVGGRLRAQHVFVVAQVALALILMVGAGLLAKSFRAQLAVDTGAWLEGIQAMRLQLPVSRYDGPAPILGFTSELQRRLEAIPGVEHASISSDLPFRGRSSGSYILRAGDGPEDRIRQHQHFVTPSHLETLGMELVDGRFLDESDREGSLETIVVTEALQQRIYPGESAVGKTMWLRPDGTLPVEIVGVVADVRYRNLITSLMADANSPDIFYSFYQRPVRGLDIAVRVRGEPAEVSAEMRRVVAELDPDLPVFRLQPLIDSWRAQTATPRFAAFLMSLFSGLAAVLACVGIYGVLAFTVGQRAQEIAIRRAIGASGGSVARAVVMDGLKLAAIGLLVGGAGAALGADVLESFLFGVETADPLTFMGVAAAMVAVAAIAALVPAVRATRHRPAAALKSD